MRQRPPPATQPDQDQDPVDARPSKTRLKQQAHELQQLGAELAELPQDRFDAAPMPEGLRDAIEQLRCTRSHEGRRRQLQFVGKQMRAADAEPLREAVALFKLGAARDALSLHEAERWRDALIANDEALTRWGQQFPDSDLQQLRSLVRAARSDAASAAATPPGQATRQSRSFRALFQFIKPHLTAADASDDASEEVDE